MPVRTQYIQNGAPFDSHLFANRVGYPFWYTANILVVCLRSRFYDESIPLPITLGFE